MMRELQCCRRSSSSSWGAFLFLLLFAFGRIQRMSDAFAPMRIVDLSQHQSQRFSSVTSLVKQQQQQSDTSHSRRNGTPHHHHHPLRQHYNSPVLPRMRLHQSATPGTPEKNVELPASVVLATTTTTLPVVSNTDTGSSSSIPLSGSVLSISSGAPSEKSLSNNSNIKTNSSNSSNNPPFLVTLDDATRSTYEQAIQRTLLWVGSAIVFGGGLWFAVGPQTGQEFFAGYLVEQSLSVDNLFVFLMLFEYFKVPLTYQDRVLNWGIYGAIVMRAIMIGLGAAALEQFHAILLVFAGILVYSSAQFFLNNNNEEEEEDVSQNSIVQFSRNLIPSTEEYDGDRFFTLVDGIRTATPLFICMIAVEVSDVVFAVDSVPAVFGVTENPLIVFSSNIFAIMGLRSLYTILSKAATDLKYLEPAVAVVLGFIGSKMIAEYFDYIIPTPVALFVVATLLGLGVGLSVWDKQRELEQEEESFKR